MSGARVLVVDDDASVTASLRLLLERAGYRSAEAASAREALERLADEPWDLVLQDMNFSRATSGEEGLELLDRIRRDHPALPVVLITAWGSVELAVAGMRRGAADFVTKPWDNQRLLEAVATALALAGTRAATAGGTVSGGALPSREQLDERYDLGGLIGEAPDFRAALDLVGRVAASAASVLVLGESGTGKELVAEALHRNSPRRRGPFVRVNLGGVPASLFESEMFGHVKGAFTDARSDRQGRFELADGGTIFLDEIGELEPASQVKLLRVLQDRGFEVLGSSRTRTVDVRVVSATNRDLGELVAEGGFREDLLYRLNLITVRLPPLRERAGDVPGLARHFLARAAASAGRPAPELTADGLDWLASRPWPGNVRQLQQTVERAVLVVEGSRIGARELARLASFETTGTRREALPEPGEMTLDEIEREMIVRSLRRFGGNVTRAARALGLSRPAFYRRCEKHGLDPSAP